MRRFGVLLALGSLLTVLVACSSQQPPVPVPTQAPAPAVTTAPAPPAKTIVPAAAATAAPTAAAAAAKPAPPTAVLEIVPVPANKADPNAIKAMLSDGKTEVALGTTGLPNVSIGVPVMLRGAAVDSTNPAKVFAWTLTAPGGSKATLSKADAAETRFTPDLPGAYKVDLAVSNDAGKSPTASVQIRAGTYIGFEKGGCKTCHSGEAAEWAKTGHATMFAEQINGGDDPANSHYGEGCLRCHSTGYYTGVANGGFADVQAKTGWKFPVLTDIQAGKDTWAAMPADLKNVSNIQCENCHGPAKDHVASQAPMAKSLDEGVCNVCHNGGGTHVKGEMFKYAAHGDETAQAFTYPVGPSRQDCVRCHSGTGYISFLKSPTSKASWDNGMQTITCAVCHDSHSNANTDQLRIVGKPVEANGITKDFALSATCVECHNVRTQAADAVKGSTPHYSAAAEMMANTGGVEYGQKIVDSPHGMIVGAAPVKDPADKEGKALLFKGNTPGPCVTCHMWPTPVDANDPNRFKVGDHSFNTVSPDGKFDYTAPCQSCHAGAKDFNLPAKADYDGNGKTEGVQTEVAGLMNVLKKAIADSGIRTLDEHPYFNRDDTAKANDKQKNAIYNYLFVRGLPGSDGAAAAVHNFKRSVSLLQLSYKDLAGKDVPNATIVK